jgi:protein tyrosine phosphatase
MPYPDHEVQWDAVEVAGIDLVIDLSQFSPSYKCRIERLSAPLEDLVGGRMPRDPEGQRNVVRTIVAEVSAARRAGKGVLVHCDGGRGRTGTVLGAFLVTLGMSPQMVERWLDNLHRQRGRDGWPESRWQSDLLQEFL